MNHKRRSRRRNDKVGERRTTHKQFRMAEAAAIRGDHAHVKQPNWSAPPREDELPDTERRGKKRPKAKRIKYCPAREGNKRHHYLEDEETVRYFVPHYYDWLPSGWRTRTHRYKLCVYCGDEKPVGGRRRRRWR